LLLNRGADIESRGPGDATPLHEAAAGGATETARLLLERGANVHALAVRGWTTIHSALERGSTELLALLIGEAGAASVNTPATEGDTPLHLAAACGNFEAVRYLLEQGAEIDARNSYGATPLVRATYEGKTECARVLLEHGADVRIRLRAGGTARDTAARSGDIELFNMVDAAVGDAVQARTRTLWRAA